MQHASDMPDVSLLEDIQRRLSLSGKQLRKGQLQCAEWVINNPDLAVMAFELVTGYGKSWVAAIVYALMRAQGRVNRLLILVPTDLQRQQYARGFEKDCRELGIEHRRLRVCSGESNVIRQSNLNTAEVFITTIQHIHADPTYYADLMEKGDWAICFDEFHRYRNGGEWGKTINSLPPYVARYGMSGTPIRTDRKDTFFPEINVRVDLRQARSEGAIRGLCVHVEKYTLDVSHNDEILHLTTANIAEQLEAKGVKDISEYEMKYEIRIHHKYINSMISHGIDMMLEKQLTGLRHQTIISAMSVKHAEELSKAIRKLYPKLKIDWVGSGAKTQEENDKVLAKFNADKNNFKHPVDDEYQWLDVLVQVKIASEGFDSVYATTGINLNLLAGKSVEADQLLGRKLRRHPGISDPGEDKADIFVSEDTLLADYYKQLEEEISGGEDSDSKMPGGGEDDGDAEPIDPRWVNIPAFFLLDMEHSGSEIHYPIDHPPRGHEDTAMQTVRAYQDKHPTVDIDELKAMVNQQLHRALNPPMSEDDRLKSARGLLDKSVRIFAGNIIRRRFGNTYEKSAMGDVIRKINLQLKKQFGIRESLDVGEIKAAYAWVQDQNELSGGGTDLPEWGEL